MAAGSFVARELLVNEDDVAGDFPAAPRYHLACRAVGACATGSAAALAEGCDGPIRPVLVSGGPALRGPVAVLPEAHR